MAYDRTHLALLSEGPVIPLALAPTGRAGWRPKAGCDELTKQNSRAALNAVRGVSQIDMAGEALTKLLLVNLSDTRVSLVIQVYVRLYPFGHTGAISLICLVSFPFLHIMVTLFDCTRDLISPVEISFSFNHPS